jgi:hypothetical protein
MAPSQSSGHAIPPPSSIDLKLPGILDAVEAGRISIDSLLIVKGGVRIDPKGFHMV